MSEASPNLRDRGSGGWSFVGKILRARLSFINVLVDEAALYGDTYRLPIPVPTFVLRDPDDIKHVLVTNPLNYHKTGGLTVGERLFGQGLVSSAEPLHGKQRKMMQPMFHKGSINSFADMMVKVTNDHVANWKDGQQVKMADEMMNLALSIVGLSLISVDLHREGWNLGHDFERALKLVTMRQLLPPMPRWMSAPMDRRYDRCIENVDEAVAKIIAEHKALPEDEKPHDLLAMLLAARYEDGSPVPDKQVRDEVITIILAGHETVANHLNWTWYLLAEHPETFEKLLQEWDEVLGDRTPGMDDVSRLTYTNMVLSESMRLFPPAWTLARRAVAEDTLPSGLVINPGEEVMMLQYVSHRNPAYFPDPEKFDPERFSPGRKGSIPKFAYFPFGMGPRYCIGEGFAKMEALVMLVLIGRKFRFELVEKKRPGMETLITLRPRGGLPMTVHKRA